MWLSVYRAMGSVSNENVHTSDNLRSAFRKYQKEANRKSPDLFRIHCPEDLPEEEEEELCLINFHCHYNKESLRA